MRNNLHFVWKRNNKIFKKVNKKKKPRRKKNRKPVRKPYPSQYLPITYLTETTNLNSKSIALLIGICYFKNNYTSQQLYGCINDVLEVKKLLKQRGYVEENIMVMTDGRETDSNGFLYPKKENIKKCLSHLYNGEIIDKNGNIIYKTSNINGVFYYSGHGANVLINSPIELDTQYNQMDFIIPCDYNYKYINSLISDIEVKQIIMENANHPYMISKFFDSCVNQTMCNLAYGYYSTLNEQNNYPYQVTDNHITRYTNLETISPLCQVVGLSGSTDKQNSLDINGIKPQGAFTKAFLSQFQDNPNKIFCWYDLLIRIRNWLKNNKYPQISQLSSANLTDMTKLYMNF